MAFISLLLEFFFVKILGRLVYFVRYNLVEVSYSIIFSVNKQS